jgi:hypothetical protein
MSFWGKIFDLMRRLQFSNISFICICKSRYLQHLGVSVEAATFKLAVDRYNEAIMLYSKGGIQHSTLAIESALRLARFINSFISIIKEFNAMLSFFSG